MNMVKPLAPLVLALLALKVGATEVVTVPLSPDPRIKEHISSIVGTARKTSVVLKRNGSSQTKRLHVDVHGPILNVDVQTLVQWVLTRGEGFWSGSGSWDVSVIGDAEYAEISVSMHCGDLCGGGETYTYGR